MTEQKALFRVLIVGGYGVFGGRLAHLLSNENDMEIVVAGRSISAAQLFCDERNAQSVASRLVPEHLPTLDELPDLITRCDIDLLINCIGPYQDADYTIAEFAITAGIAYLDLADGREFVDSFESLHEKALSTGALAITGASTLPAISAAAVDHLGAELTSIETINMAIAPGLKMPRGVAVVRAILGYTGQPVRVLRDGHWVELYGWQDLRRRNLAIEEHTTGTRWLGICDVPDLALFPRRYPGIRTVEFRAGLELAFLHLGLWASAWFVRARLIRTLVPLARPMKWLADLFQPLGSDRGGMFVDITGTDSSGQRIKRSWTLIADSGHGPWIPILPALIMTRKIRDDRIALTGAFPCMGFFELVEFEKTIAAFDIRTKIVETQNDA